MPSTSAANGPSSSADAPTNDGPPVSAHWDLAQKRLSPTARNYFFGGAGAESCLTANKNAFARVRFRPRTLVDVSAVDTSTSVTSALPSLPHPFLIAPMALQTLACPAGEAAVARAAAAHGVPMILSMLSGTPAATVASAGGPWLQQIYILRDRALTLSIAARARAAGARALVLTVDAPRYGRRPRDEAGGLQLPPGVGPSLLASGLGPAGAPGTSALSRFGDRMLDASLDERAVGWLASASGLPVWVKGVLRADDAERAVRAGAAAVVVSNHGGRQMEGAVAALDALEEVARAVGGRVPVLVDSGVRRAEDVLKAVALGASAVLVGRPVLAALAADGERGVRRLLGEFAEGVRLAMGLAGVASLRRVERSLVETAEERVARAVHRQMRAKL